MASVVLLLQLAALAQLGSFALLRWLGDRLVRPLTGWVAATLAMLSFVAVLLAMIRWYEGAHDTETWGMGVRAISQTIGWFPSFGIFHNHRGFFDLGFYVDSLTIAMFAMVTMVAAILQIFSIGFTRKNESGFCSNFALVCFAMLGLLISGTLLQILLFWGLLGVASHWLISPAAQPRPLPNTLMRRWIVFSIGDLCFLAGAGILVSKLQQFSLPTVWMRLGGAASGHAIVLPDGAPISVPLMTLAGIFLFGGAAARAAQFPLHIWLADTVADIPAPAAALVAGVTTGTAGLYLVARLFPILTPDTRLFIAITGLTTLTVATLIATAQTDLCRLFGWIAVAQLGYVTLALGVGSWVGGLFFLIAFGFIISLLILAAGSTVAACRSERNILRLGGLWSRLPATGSALLIGTLAMAGVPWLGKFNCQSIVLTDAAAFAQYAMHPGGRAWEYWLFFLLPAAMAYVTSFTLFRCWMLIFAGRSRNVAIQQSARENPALWAPLLTLAGVAVICGYAMNIPDLLRASIIETKSLCDELASSTGHKGERFTAFDQAWPSISSTAPTRRPEDPVERLTPVLSPAGQAHEYGRELTQIWVNWAWLIGITTALALYWKGRLVAGKVVCYPPMSWINAWLLHGMFFEELYDWTLVSWVGGLISIWIPIFRTKPPTGSSPPTTD